MQAGDQSKFKNDAPCAYEAKLDTDEDLNRGKKKLRIPQTGKDRKRYVRQPGGSADTDATQPMVPALPRWVSRTTVGGCIPGVSCLPVCLVGPETQGPRSDRASASVPLHPCNHPMTGGDGRSANAWWWTAARDTRVEPWYQNLVRPTRLVAAMLGAETSFFAYRAATPKFSPCGGRA